jgi:hypothetical protein
MIQIDKYASIDSAISDHDAITAEALVALGNNLLD